MEDTPFAKYFENFYFTNSIRSVCCYGSCAACVCSLTCHLSCSRSSKIMAKAAQTLKVSRNSFLSDKAISGATTL